MTKLPYKRFYFMEFQKALKSDFLENSNFGLTRYFIDLADFWHVVLEWCPKY